MFASIKRTARTGRLRTELMLLDREVRQRQQAFGVVLYDYLEPLAKSANFFSADDRLTQVLRGPLLEAQRETAVVYNKIRQLKERMKQAEVTRAAAFPTPAANWQEKMKNAGKSTALAASETKLKAEMVILERELKSHKQNFGVSLYPTLEHLEDQEGWLVRVEIPCPCKRFSFHPEKGVSGLLTRGSTNTFHMQFNSKTPVESHN